MLKVSSNFWKVWKEFEVQHGNEDTMREMLRIKRSVQAMYNTQVNMMSAQMLNNVSNQVSGVQIDSMRALDNKISGKSFNDCDKIIIIVIIDMNYITIDSLLSETTTQSGLKDTIKFVRGITETDGKESSRVNNPDEIDIDMDMDDDNENEGEEEIEEGNSSYLSFCLYMLLFLMT